MINGKERALLKMIRFCDKEVYCATEEALDRQQLILYFLNGHRNEPVCVLDENARFIGLITYSSLLENEIEDAVLKDYIILDQNIWENGRKYFRSCQKTFGEVALLPVLNRKGQLVCFAWQDEEANRELRMLDELLENNNTVSFKDLYPEIECVTIYGCNELSFYFIQYLKKYGILVHVKGDIWEELGIIEEANVLDYKNLVIYGEGTDNLFDEVVERRKSVSEEFECIDKIYEENICRGIITDACGNFQCLCEKLKKCQIAILGIGDNSLNAYDLLIDRGLDIACFVSNNLEEQGKFLFGKKILSRNEAMESFDKIVFLETSCKYSAWGGAGGIDYYYYYFSYKRNERFFLLQDYVEIPDNGFLSLLEHVMIQSERALILAGDICLCLKLSQILEEKNKHLGAKIAYCDFLNEYIEYKKLNTIKPDDMCKNDICLLLIPRYYGCYAEQGRLYREVVLEKFLETIKYYKVSYIVNYNWENKAFMSEQHFVVNKTVYSDYKVKKIVLGSTLGFMGNKFLRSLLDNHPEVIMLTYNYLNSNLYYICLRLSVENNDNILSQFWKLYNSECWLYSDTDEKSVWTDVEIKRFNKSMQSMLSKKKKFSSQELFVMLHIAFTKIWKEEVTDISNIVIYWEPHIAKRRCEKYSNWLRTAAISGCILNVVRNACIWSGSWIRYLDKEGILPVSGEKVFELAFQYPYDDQQEFNEWKQVVVRFEDLKTNSKNELLFLCNELEINWSDTLLLTTLYGKQDFYGDVTGYELKPVYRTHEEYYSVFDRFRISLLVGPWQKKYGYPYVNSLDFSRRELQEMFLKEFRFEERLVYRSCEEKKKIKKRMQAMIRNILWITRRKEIMEKKML